MSGFAFPQYLAKLRAKTAYSTLRYFFNNHSSKNGFFTNKYILIHSSNNNKSDLLAE
jgi:hypothetical protein